MIFVDECLFTSNTFKTHAWMLKGDNVTLKNKTVAGSRCVACVGGISAQRGLVTSLLRDRSIKQNDFCDFLQQLRDCSDKRPLHVVLDNCRVHHAKTVKKFALDHDIELIYLKPYSPEMNPIELVWAQVKSTFRSELLDAFIQRQKPVFIRELLVTALKNVNQAVIRAYIDKSLAQMFE